MDKGRETGILVIAASIIAVIRLRGQDIHPSPKAGVPNRRGFRLVGWKLVATIKDSVEPGVPNKPVFGLLGWKLARLVLAEVERGG